MYEIKEWNESTVKELEDNLIVHVLSVDIPDLVRNVDPRTPYSAKKPLVLRFGEKPNLTAYGIGSVRTSYENGALRRALQNGWITDKRETGAKPSDIHKEFISPVKISTPDQVPEINTAERDLQTKPTIDTEDVHLTTTGEVLDASGTPNIIEARDLVEFENLSYKHKVKWIQNATIAEIELLREIKVKAKSATIRKMAAEKYRDLFPNTEEI